MIEALHLERFGWIEVLEVILKMDDFLFMGWVYAMGIQNDRTKSDNMQTNGNHDICEKKRKHTTRSAIKRRVINDDFEEGGE